MAIIGLNIAQIKDRARRYGREISDAEAQSILDRTFKQEIYGADPGAVDALLKSSAPSRSSAQTTSPDDLLASLIKENQKQFDELAKRYEEFEANNPFSFDEVLARASAEERYNPYYEAELSDYVSGINRRRESELDDRQLLTELNRMGVTQDKRALDNAIRASEEGYAGAGLFFSGAQERATGQTNIAGQEQAQNRRLQYDSAMRGSQRNIESLGQSERTGRRNIGAARTTAIETDITNQRAEERARREEERAQYIGFPYTTGAGVQGGFNQLLQSTFSY